MSIPKVKIAVLKNLLIFGEKYLPQSVRLLEGGAAEMLFGRIPFEHALSLPGASLMMIGEFGFEINLSARPAPPAAGLPGQGTWLPFQTC